MHSQYDLSKRHEVRDPFHEPGLFRERNDGVSANVEFLLSRRRIPAQAFVNDSIEF